MWLLRNESKGLIFRIHPGKQNVVSRKDGDLLLVGDQSISRKHAELTVHNENGNAGIVLKDLGSKYGTFTIIGEGELTQMSANQQVTLSDGDSIRFGIQWNIWRVEYFPLVVTTSTLNAAEKTEVKDMVSALGGEVVNDWQTNCTHLTMNKLTLTVKVVCSLACGKPIVMPGYWKALKDSLACIQTKLPDCKEFTPPLAEALLNPSEVSFTPKSERSILFSGYTFVAASARQLARIKPMITAAGGNAVEFSASLWPESKLKKTKTILMQHTAADKQGSQQSQVPDGYIAAARNLKAAGVRCVPESEIGLSILYCSMAQYCNPKFSRQSLFGSSTSQNTQEITVIRPNNLESTKQQSNQVTLGSTAVKRVLEDSREQELNPSKKINAREDSEDMFTSPDAKNKIEKRSNIASLTLNKPDTKENRPVINRSLDMFAPSGQISGQSDINRNSLNKTKPSNLENDPKEKPPIVCQSLDMFAPSGHTSSKENKNEVPSCQDIFASNERQKTEEKKRSDCNESLSIPTKQPRMAQLDEDDEFSFTRSKKTTKHQKVVAEKDDEFSFSSTRRSKRRQPDDEEDGDEFSFVSNKKGKHQKMTEVQDDDFSFVSSKNSKRRNCQKNPDAFSSSAESSTSNDRASGHQSNKKVNLISANNENDLDSEDLFAFVEGPPLKRRKDNKSSLITDEPDTEVKLALLSKKEQISLDLHNASEPNLCDDPPDDKNLMTYSKDKPCPGKIKEEVIDEEVDELAQVLHNATIVVVKSLVVPREKPTKAEPTSNVKNFKKFRKVIGMNKRIVPRIIGGSDLVPHYANCQNIDDVLPPSPPHMSPDDDWGFPKEKKKGKNR